MIFSYFNYLLYINSSFTLNLKTGVVSHPREGEVVLTADYEALGSHYQTAIMPAGIRKPKHYRRKNVIGNLSLNKRYNRILRLNCCL